MQPMLASLYDPSKVSLPAIAEPKIDGIRAMLRCDGGRIVSAVSREGEALPALAVAVGPLAAAVSSCWVDVEIRHGRFVRVRLDRTSRKVDAPTITSGHPLVAWRNHRGMTQRSLAEASGVQASYIAAIESKKKPGSIAAWYRLALALGTTIETLLPADILAE